ncbi:hypothetical protein DEO72_LG11g1491 [Vigna unguiculata]|uniref:Uncharacterized protein n=1 Tax=Vigna unguiculata TaxID=3917 RepID=A0A4D6NL30_VIGUN|nr:hypothetical protein DEO72_LG11g1491 [Vigna unguiculata]
MPQPPPSTVTTATSNRNNSSLEPQLPYVAPTLENAATIGSTRTNTHQHKRQPTLIEPESMERALAPAFAHYAGVAMPAPSSSFSTLPEPQFTVCTFIFATTFMTAPCLNVKSPHSILQWSHHSDLQSPALPPTTILARERGPDATSPQQSQTQQHLSHQLPSHDDNHHNLA